MSNYKFGNRSLSKLVGVHPYLVGVCWKTLQVSGVDFGVFDGVRTVSEQRQMVENGLSKTMDSFHLYGLAVDLVPFVEGQYTWESKEAFQEIKEAVHSVMDGDSDIPIVENGLALWEWDAAHWQMTDFKDKYDIRKLR